MKYTRIEKVELDDGQYTFKNQYLLTGDNCNYELDLLGGWCINQFEVLNREFIIEVNNIDEVINFCKNNKIDMSLVNTENILLSPNLEYEYLDDYSDYIPR